MKPVAIFRHSAGEGPGYFATFLERHSVPWLLVRVDEGEAVPVDPTLFSGLAFMGGPMSVNDCLAWVGQECELIRAACAQDIPVVGHCLGGQLIAKALGGMVTRNAVKEIGWGEVQVLENNAARQWFGDLRSFLSFHWHGETFSMPAGAAHILASPYCPHQAFALGPHLAMQCHIEMTAPLIERWCVSGAREIAACAVPSVQQCAQIRAGLEAKVEGLHAVADRVYTKWIEGLKRS